MENQKTYLVTFVEQGDNGRYQEWTTLVSAESIEDAKAIAKVDNPYAEEMTATLFC